MKLILVFESKRLRTLQQKHALLLTSYQELEAKYQATLRRAVNAEDIQTSTVESSLRKQAKADAEIAELKQEKERLLSEKMRAGATHKGQTFYGPKELEHNPHNLTPEQYGMGQGYRLLDKDEILPMSHAVLDAIEGWEPGVDRWVVGLCGSSPGETYRTRLAREQLRAARGLK